jgi:hypothetical protein
MVAGLEGLRIFRLAEALADEIWEEVITWNFFARDSTPTSTPSRPRRPHHPEKSARGVRL